MSLARDKADVSHYQTHKDTIYYKLERGGATDLLLLSVGLHWVVEWAGLLA